MKSSKGEMTPESPLPVQEQECSRAAALLEVRGLTKHFPIRKLGKTVAQVRAVDGVSFCIGRGKTVGLVGETGSGKSTTARLVTRLEEPTTGTLTFDGVDLLACGGRELKNLRKRIQMIFQDPFGSLNPRLTILDIVGEPLVAHGIAKGREKARRVEALLETVGLSRADLQKHPHQFSGGQAQRIGIARALATDPDLIVCDEAVSALDVSVQAQVLNLLKRLQRDRGLSYLFIAHDLNVVRYMSSEIHVMYLGEVVETGDADTLFAQPQHPYTQTLVAAVPNPDPDEARGPQRSMTRGEVPSPTNPPPGCRFHTRCPYAFPRCSDEPPALQRVARGQDAACHLHDSGGKAPAS